MNLHPCVTTRTTAALKALPKQVEVLLAETLNLAKQDFFKNLLGYHKNLTEKPARQ